MKKLLLSVLIALLMVVPAYAAEGGDEAAEEPEATAVTVETLEELQEAVAAAEDGDTITITSKIYVRNATVTTDKRITLTRGPNYTSGELFLMQSGGTLDGFDFRVTDTTAITIVVTSKSASNIAKIENCRFYGCESAQNTSIYLNQSTISSISNCEFYNSAGRSIDSGSLAKFTIEDCRFIDNNNDCVYITWGEVQIKNCIFKDNRFSNGVVTENNGVLLIKNCQFTGNNHKQKGTLADIRISGKSQNTLQIVDEEVSGVEYYNYITGEKLTLPFDNDIDAETIILYLTDKEAADIFGIEYVDESQNQGNPDDKDEEQSNTPDNTDNNSEENEDNSQEGENDNPAENDIPNNPEKEDGDKDNSENTPETSQEPEDQDKGEDTAKDENTPQEPSQDSTGNNNNGGEEQEPEQPEDQDNDDPADFPQPETPSQDDTIQDDDNSDDDYTPPVYRPSRPSHSSDPEPEPKQEPQPENNPAPAQQLVCGEARIDTSRTIILLGYGDGQAHEADPLTRAQMAAIVYRLLDDDTIARYSEGDSRFADVAPDAWYAPFVQIIHSAGIVNGVGEGSYNPDGLVTWAQIVTVLSRFVEAQNYSLQYISYDGWAQEALQTAAAYGWIVDSADFEPDAVINRGELVQLVNGVLAMYR